MQLQERYSPFQQELSKNPETLRAMFAAFHNSDAPLDDCFIDTVLDLPALGDGLERYMDSNYFFVNGQEEFVVYQGTPYEKIRTMLRWTNPTSSDVFRDIGSGYGKVCLYGALATEARFVGHELLPHRIEVAENAKNRFGITNAEFVLGNVADHNLEDGTIFYLFNSLIGPTEDKVLDRLQQIAEKKLIKFISYSTWMQPENAPSWLKVVKRSTGYDPFFLFESR